MRCYDAQYSIRTKVWHSVPSHYLNPSVLRSVGPPRGGLGSMDARTRKLRGRAAPLQVVVEDRLRQVKLDPSVLTAAALGRLNTQVSAHASRRAAPRRAAPGDCLPFGRLSTACAYMHAVHGLRC